MYYVYIIRNKDETLYYTGHTNNLADRVNRHNKNKNIYTRNKGPWNLVYSETFETRSKAMKREKDIKNKKSKKYIEWLISNN